MSNIKYRYIKSGNAYLPQRSFNEGIDWSFFKEIDLENRSNTGKFKNTLLGAVVYALTELSPLTRTVRFMHGGIKKEATPFINFEGQTLIHFQEEIHVMAFLGAAKSYYSEQIKEVDL